MSKKNLYSRTGLFGSNVLISPCIITTVQDLAVFSKARFFGRYARISYWTKCFGSISQLETRPGFQLTYVSKTLMLPKNLHMIRPLVQYEFRAWHPKSLSLENTTRSCTIVVITKDNRHIAAK